MNTQRPLTIGIDIDGTVTCPSSIVPPMNEAFGRDLQLADCYEYNLANVYGISDEEFARWLDEYGERLYSSAPVHELADQFLRQWHGQHRLVYISARDPKHMDVTVEWFNRTHIPFHYIDLIGSHDKLKAATKWQVDLFLEDRLENALQLSDALQIPVFLFDTPYNQGALPPLIHRISSWREIDLSLVPDKVR